MDRWKLEAEIKRKGYTIASFSREINIERSTLWRKLTGLSDFTVGEVRKICEALEIEDPREFFFTDMVAFKQH